MSYPPNTFLQFWSDKELKDWIKELRARKLYRVNDKSVPTIKQTNEELLRRK